MSKLLFRVIALSVVLCILVLPQSSQAGLLDGLISYWPLDEGGGTTAGDAVGSNDGTLLAGQGGGAIPAWVAGKFGTALDFDGLSSYVDCGGDASLKPTSAVTLSAWVKFNAYGYYGQVAGIAHDESSDEAGYSLIVDDYYIAGSSESISAWLGTDDDSLGTYWSLSPPPTAGSWHHIALTYDADANSAVLYVNGLGGLPMTSENGEIDYDVVTTFKMGVYAAGGWWLPYEGLIDEVAVWDRALLPYEISQLYNGGAGRILIFPSAAWGPDPGDGEKHVLLDETLSWNTGLDPNSGMVNTGITTHVLYMTHGDDPDDPNSDPNMYQIGPPIAASGATGQYPPTPGGEWLKRDGIYLWRVDEVEPNSPVDIIYTGRVWKFEAARSIPNIDPATPASAMVELNGTAIFTVSAINPFTNDPCDLSYQWYKESEPNGVAIGTDSPTLTINNAQYADEGKYYCIVTIGFNSKTDSSRSADLGIRRLLAHWKLDDAAGTTAADSSGNSNTGTVHGAASPAWITGIDGGALSFDGVGEQWSVETDYVDCGDPNSLKPTMQVTVSAWIKTDATSYYGQIAGFAADTGSYESGYSIITEEGGEIGAWITGESGDGSYLWTDDVPAFPNVDWVHVALTYDGTTSILYVNGEAKDSQTTSGNIDYDHVNSFKIGLYDDPVGDYWFPYEGDIDDVKVYNYALDALAIAQEYVTLSGGTVCLDPPPLDITGPDGEPDCIINLWDFQGMAASWFECNIVPVENCPSGGV